VYYVVFLAQSSRPGRQWGGSGVRVDRDWLHSRHVPGPRGQHAHRQALLAAHAQRAQQRELAHLRRSRPRGKMLG
jgi:hypothetical protein